MIHLHLSQAEIPVEHFRPVPFLKGEDASVIAAFCLSIMTICVALFVVVTVVLDTVKFVRGRMWCATKTRGGTRDVQSNDEAVDRDLFEV